MLGRTVLLVSRQPELRRQLRVTLSRHGAQLTECRRAREAGALLASRRRDLILLDLSVQDSTTAEATQLIRTHGALALIALVAAHDEQQRIAALDAGVDDCIVVPCASNEMLTCIGRALERTQRSLAQMPPDAFRAGALEVDFPAREVRLHGKAIHVTPTEYKLLRVLIESAGKVVTQERLLREVWGPAAIQQVRRLRVHMKQLGRKFELEPPFARYLITEPAVGYRIWVPA